MLFYSTGRLRRLAFFVQEVQEDRAPGAATIAGHGQQSLGGLWANQNQMNHDKQPKKWKTHEKKH